MVVQSQNSYNQKDPITLSQDLSLSEGLKLSGELPSEGLPLSEGLRLPEGLTSFTGLQSTEGLTSSNHGNGQAYSKARVLPWTDAQIVSLLVGDKFTNNFKENNYSEISLKQIQSKDYSGDSTNEFSATTESRRAIFNRKRLPTCADSKFHDELRQETSDNFIPRKFNSRSEQEKREIAHDTSGTSSQETVLGKTITVQIKQTNSHSYILKNSLSGSYGTSWIGSTLSGSDSRMCSRSNYSEDDGCDQSTSPRLNNKLIDNNRSASYSEDSQLFSSSSHDHTSSAFSNASSPHTRVQDFHCIQQRDKSHHSIIFFHEMLHEIKELLRNPSSFQSGTYPDICIGPCRSPLTDSSMTAQTISFSRRYPKIDQFFNDRNSNRIGSHEVETKPLNYSSTGAIQNVRLDEIQPSYDGNTCHFITPKIVSPIESNHLQAKPCFCKTWRSFCEWDYQAKSSSLSESIFDKAVDNFPSLYENSAICDFSAPSTKRKKSNKTYQICLGSCGKHIKGYKNILTERGHESDPRKGLLDAEYEDQEKTFSNQLRNNKRRKGRKHWKGSLPGIKRLLRKTRYLKSTKSHRYHSIGSF